MKVDERITCTDHTAKKFSESLQDLSLSSCYFMKIKSKVFFFKPGTFQNYDVLVIDLDLNNKAWLAEFAQ